MAKSASGKFCSGCLIVLLLAWMSHGASIPNDPPGSTLMLGYSVPWSLDWTVGPVMGAGLIVGIDEVIERQILPDYNIDWVWRDSGCKPAMGFVAVAEMWEDVDDLDGIIGDGCSIVCEPISLLAAAWNIPILSFACASMTLSDKVEYPTFTRSVSTWAGYVPFWVQLIDTLGWDRVAVVTDTADLYRLVAEKLRVALDEKGYKVFYRTIESTFAGAHVLQDKLQAQREVVQDIKKEARLVFIANYGQDFRSFLISCMDEGMMNGEYIFIGLDIWYLATDTTFTYRPEVGSELYIGVINTRPKVISGPEWDEFRSKVLVAFNDSRFDGVDRLSTADSIDDVNIYAGYVHDAVLMWAYGVNKTIEEGGAVDDGVTVASNIFNLRFNGITGYIGIDGQGDRKLDQEVLILQEDASYHQIYDFKAVEDLLDPVYDLSGKPLLEWTGFQWSQNASAGVPTGVPACGWEGELCVVEEESSELGQTALIGIVLGVIVFLVVLAVPLVYFYLAHRKKMNMAQAMTLILKADEIDTKESEGDAAASALSLGAQANTKVQTAASASNLLSIPFSNIRGRFRYKPVMIRTYSHSFKGTNDPHLIEDLMEIKDVNHDNINKFTGVSLITAGKLLVLTEYASRGSLHNVISDEDVNLTWDIKLSLATDIVRGMLYLQSTSLHAHGHLTSGNCVVDKRWTCKITDFGLPHIRHPPTEITPESQLWAAPEVLRGEAHLRGMQKADVYSFGIIVQELITEGTPYSENGVTAAEAVQRVREGQRPAYRPVIPSDACEPGWTNLAQSCWHDDSNTRISFGAALDIIREINGGKLPRLVDSMISRLEKHTLHLEELVADRTKEVHNEKAKVEILLCELLPATVADQLKAGGTVAPETYDHCTLFFSDIVGFTRVSAQSSPMQVVAMLNKLYTLFDDVLGQYDVYKVATIGDAYMVVSGIPTPNGDKHASEIVLMSLALIDSIKVFPIPHLPHEQLYMRVGVHSGGCVAGVTGKKMPRYLLFGDTVDTASHVEAGGEAMRVHVSETTIAILKKENKFDIEHRGPMSIKGRDSITTYWVNGRL